MIQTDPFSEALHPWWHSAVVYQVYPRSFADSDGDGVGDLRGVLTHLDHLVALGVDALWLCPFFRSPQDDNGYDVSDYLDVDPMFGTLADAEALIAGCHDRGIRVVLDMVMNHTSDEHPWFVESRDPASDKRDWYFWAPPRPGHTGGEPGAEPTNWGSAFGGSAWEYDPASGEYYLHLFSPKQPDLNWANPAVREAMIGILLHWVGKGADGFRFDVINLIGKPLTDGRLSIGDGTPGADGLAHDSAELIDLDRMHAYLKEVHERVLAGRDMLTVGEMPGMPAEVARRLTDPAEHELGMIFTFDHMCVDQVPGGSKFDLVPMHLPTLKACLSHWQDELAGIGWNSLYWNNHDHPRVVSRWGDPSPDHREHCAKTFATTLHLMKGTPYVYQGEEIGMINPRLAREEYRDVESLHLIEAAPGWGKDDAWLTAALETKGRDNARTPMQWDDSEHAGFTTGTPWLPVAEGYREINARAARADAGSVFHHYRALITLRHTMTLVSEGEFELLAPEHEQLFAYTRRFAGQVMLVVANWSSRPCPLEPGALGVLSVDNALMVLGTHGDDGTPTTLRPWESRVYLWL